LSPYSAASATSGTVVEKTGDYASSSIDDGDLPTEVGRDLQLFELTWKQRALFGCGSIGLRMVTASAPLKSATGNLFNEVTETLALKYGKGEYKYDDSASPAVEWWRISVGGTRISVRHQHRTNTHYGTVVIYYNWARWEDAQARRAACRGPRSLDKL
jgi:hypothetical protein